MAKKLNKKENDIRPVSQKEFDNWLGACINTPPVKYKDWKARLKKEREEKRKRTE